MLRRLLSCFVLLALLLTLFALPATAATPALCGASNSLATWGADSTVQLLTMDNDGINKSAIDLSTGLRTFPNSSLPKDLWFEGSTGTLLAAHNGWGLLDLGAPDYASTKAIPANGYAARIKVAAGHVYLFRRDASQTVYKLYVSTYNPGGMYPNLTLQYAAGSADCTPTSALAAAAPWGAPADAALEQSDNLDGMARDGFTLQTGDRHPWGNQGGDFGLTAGGQLQTVTGGFIDLGAVDWNQPKSRPAKGWQTQITLVPGHLLLFQGLVVAKIQVLNVDTSLANAAALRYSVATGNVPLDGVDAVVAPQASYTTSQAVLTWSAPSQPLGTVAGYYVYRGTSSGSYDTTPVGTVSGLTFTDSTAQAGQTYYYVVKPYYTDGTTAATSTEIVLSTTASTGTGGSGGTGTGGSGGSGGTPSPSLPSLISHQIRLQVGSGGALVDGSDKTLDVPPQIVSGRTMVPLRFIGEALGASITYDADTRSVTYSVGNVVLVLTIDSTTATLNGQTVVLDVAPTIVDGRTLIPVRFVSESLGAQVTYEPTTRTVLVKQISLPPGVSITDADTFVKIGDAALKRADYDAALFAYRQALQFRPDSASILNDMGIASAHKGDYDAAVKYYSRAIVLKPTSATLYANRAMAYYDAGKYDETIADMNQAIGLDSTSAVYFNRRANAYFKKAQYDLAVADYTQALQISPTDAVVLTNRASANHHLGNDVQAANDLVAAIKAKPNYAPAFNLFGTLLLGQSQWNDAIDAFTRAINLRPDYSDAYLGRGKAYRAKGNTDAAVADFQKVLSLTAGTLATQAQQQLQEMGVGTQTGGGGSANGALVGLYVGLRIPGTAYVQDNTLIISSGVTTPSSLLINADGTYAWNSAWDGKIIYGKWRAAGDTIILLNGQEGKDWTVERSDASHGGGGDIYVWDGNIWYTANRAGN